MTSKLVCTQVRDTQITHTHTRSYLGKSSSCHSSLTSMLSMRKVTSAVPILWEDGPQLAVDDKQKRHVWKPARTGTLTGSRLEKGALHPLLHNPVELIGIVSINVWLFKLEVWSLCGGCFLQRCVCGCVSSVCVSCFSHWSMRPGGKKLQSSATVAL